MIDKPYIYFGSHRIELLGHSYDGGEESIIKL